MGITLIVDPEAARALHGHDKRHVLVQAIDAGGGKIYPMPAFAPDEPGARTFTIEAADPHRLAERLRPLPGVEACYVKPADELP